MNLNHRAIMGIVNVTDDSFFAESRVRAYEVTERARTLLAEGADIIDVGCCSTRPESIHVDEEEEWRRVESALYGLADIDCQISLDTYRVRVARRALELRSGLIINDVSGGSEAMYDVVAEAGATYILTHSVAAECGASVDADDEKIVARVCRFFEHRLNELQKRGAKSVILDVGIGFSGGVANDFRLLGGLGEFARFGPPLLVGVSRKRLVWQSADTDADNALAGSLALGWQALMGGATILRTHDVGPTKQMYKIFERYKALNR